MRRLLCACLLAIALPAMAQERLLDACMDTAQVQPEVNACGHDERVRADAEMNRVYQQVLRRQPHHRKALVAAQRAWLAYRDAEMDARFPDAVAAPNGSSTPLCMALAMAELTRARTAVLRQWLDDGEGDVCALPDFPKDP